MEKRFSVQTALQLILEETKGWWYRGKKIQNARITFLKIQSATEYEEDNEHQPAQKPAHQQPALGSACEQQATGPDDEQPAMGPDCQQLANNSI